MRGAFTGADRDRKGLFREADGRHHPPRRDRRDAAEDAGGPAARAAGEDGTPRRRRPRGARRHAHHRRDEPRPLPAGRRGTFREDLFYRLNVIQVHIPPLRERARTSRRSSTTSCRSSPRGTAASARRSRARRCGALRAPWPGNVRQLEHVLLNAWLMSDGTRDRARTSSSRRPPPPSCRPRSARPREEAPARARTSPGRVQRRRARTHPARPRRLQLEPRESGEDDGVPRRTFYRRLKEYGIL